MSMQAPSKIIDEILGKHSRSAQPESQHLVAVTLAIKEVVLSEKLEVTPTSLFAAAMSALEQPATQSTPQVVRHLTACHLPPRPSQTCPPSTSGMCCSVYIPWLHSAPRSQRNTSGKVCRMHFSHRQGARSTPVAGKLPSPFCCACIHTVLSPHPYSALCRRAPLDPGSSAWDRFSAP
jgi:hypothetical protein